MIRRTFLQSIGAMVAAGAMLHKETRQPVVASDSGEVVEHCGACCLHGMMLDVREDDCESIGWQ